MCVSMVLTSRPNKNEIVIKIPLKLKFETGDSLGYIAKSKQTKNPAISDGIFFYTELNY